MVCVKFAFEDPDKDQFSVIAIWMKSMTLAPIAL